MPGTSPGKGIFWCKFRCNKPKAAFGANLDIKAPGSVGDRMGALLVLVLVIAVWAALWMIRAICRLG
jgi:hypothetical protein